MALGLVNAAVAKRKLFTQGESELAEPPVVGSGLPSPNRTRVIDVGLAIGPVIQLGGVNDPVGGIQELCRFEYHLHDMLVAMIHRSLAGTEVEKEDVHGTGLEPGDKESVLLASVEGREDGEDHDIWVSRNHDHELQEPGRMEQILLGRGLGTHGHSTASKAKQALSVHVSFGEDDQEVLVKEDKH
jgi:hypothetical protein